MRIKKLFFYIHYYLMHLLIPLNPSYHGEECLYNGEHTGVECCCDNCDYYLVCFPDWKEYME